MMEITTTDKVSVLEAELLKLPQVDLSTAHCLSGGVYARTIVIPSGTALTGATHKKDHINIVFGDITVTTDDGMKRLTGHHVFATKSGAKRAGYTHTETQWTTICATSLSNIADIEDELVEESDRLQNRLMIEG